MTDTYNQVRDLLTFLEKSPTPFHAAANAAARLEQAGFARLREDEIWNFAAGDRCYVVRGDSSIVAFCVPESGWGPVHLAAAHTDSPCFKVKENGELTVQEHYRKLDTEGYGGMLMASWLDRPLSVAGRLCLAEGDGVRTRLFDLDRDLLVIPSVAIHQNRTANTGYVWNAQTDLAPLFGVGAGSSLSQLACRAAKEDPERLLAADMTVYCRTPGTVLGAEGELFGAPRIDDLACVWSTLEGFLSAKPAGLAVWAAFDNEEVGSVTRQGACSTFLADTLERVCQTLGGQRQDYLAALAGSFLVSADNAHALHPNHPELSDPANPVFLNGGVVLKYNASQKYTTDAVSGGFWRSVCKRAGVPLQTFANRSDLPGGSTLGNLSNTQVSVRAVDIGLPQLAMHAAWETAGARDVAQLVQAMQAYYETPLAFF